MSRHETGMWTEGKLFSTLVFFPFVLFVLLAVIGFVDFDSAAVFFGFFMGLPFWFFIVMPVYFISGDGRRWSLQFTVTLSFLILAVPYAVLFWSPGVESLVIGPKILVIKGLPTALWYHDMFTLMASCGLAVLTCTPIFQRYVQIRVHAHNSK